MPLAATNRPGRTAAASVSSSVPGPAPVAVPALATADPPPAEGRAAAGLLVAEPAPAGPVAAAGPAAVGESVPFPAVAGLAGRCARVLLSPWSRFSLLVAVLGGAVTAVLLFEPQRLLADGWPPHLGGLAAAAVFAAAYGLCTVAFVPRPLLNLASGALFGAQLGLAAAVAGTVLGAGTSFCLGRMLGQDALRPLLRGRLLTSLDGQLSRHGFRSVLAVRLFPGVPFQAANYCAAVSRTGLAPFLLATGLGSVPNTAAYAVAGARAGAPASPAFLAALACIAVPASAGLVVAWRRRHRLRGR